MLPARIFFFFQDTPPRSSVGAMSCSERRHLRSLASCIPAPGFVGFKSVLVPELLCRMKGHHTTSQPPLRFPRASVGCERCHGGSFLCSAAWTMMPVRRRRHIRSESSTTAFAFQWARTNLLSSSQTVREGVLDGDDHRCMYM